jgi:hypothetical protein
MQTRRELGMKYCRHKKARLSLSSQQKDRTPNTGLRGLRLLRRSSKGSAYGTPLTYPFTANLRSRGKWSF